MSCCGSQAWADPGLIPSLTFHAVPCTRPRVVIGIGQSTENAIGPRGVRGGCRCLEVVADGALTLHLQDVFGQVGVAGLYQGSDDFDDRDRAVEQHLSSSMSAMPVTIGHILAAVGCGGCLDLGIADLGEVKCVEDRLDGQCSSASDLENGFVSNGVDAAIDTHVPLDDMPVIEFCRVEVASAEHVVVAWDRSIPRGDEVGARDELRSISLALSCRHLRVGGQCVDS